MNSTTKMLAGAHHRSVYSHATKEHAHFPGEPHAFEADAYFETEEAAAAFAARFPKGLRVKATICSGFPDGKGGYKTLGMVYFKAYLDRDGTTHGKNESSIKRIRGFFRACEKLGVELEWRKPYVNSYATRAEFDAALSAEEAS